MAAPSESPAHLCGGTIPQTSQCAEWCAMGVATEMRCSTSTIYSDSAVVVSGCDRGASGMALPDHSKKVHGATARQVCYRLRGKHDVSVEKCRAHQPQPEQGTPEYRIWEGTDKGRRTMCWFSIPNNNLEEGARQCGLRLGRMPQD